jgi:hypothetical protein
MRLLGAGLLSIWLAAASAYDNGVAKTPPMGWNVRRNPFIQWPAAAAPVALPSTLRCHGWPSWLL